MRKSPVLSAGIIILLLFSSIAMIHAAFGQTDKGPYIDQARFIFRDDENLALEEVRNGDLDMYHFRIALEAAPAAERDPRLQVHHRQAGSMGLFVNPAPSVDSTIINPFQFREARYALNYLVDRESVVNLVQKGYGTPMIDPFGVSSPEYLNVIDIVESFGFRYNPALAEKMISDAMTGAGAMKQNGKWTYSDNPVTIKMLIRQDDTPRKSLGEIVASELEKIGFTVQKEYGDLNKATTVVYGTDPKELQWHLYTEGFAGTSVFVQYNPVVPAQMYGPWFGRMPGGQNPAYWNYQNATLDELTQNIFFFNFTSEAERNDLVRKSAQMGVQESVRIFVTQKTDPFVASANLRGLVNDFGAGITSKYSLLNVQQADGSKSLDIGVKQIHQGSWNSIGGLQDTYSREIYHSVADSGTFRDPYTGEIIPYRAEWTDISTEGPENRMEVDPGAQVWDPATQTWKAGGGSALSKVTFRPLYSNWHNGIPMDVSDMMYSQYFFFEWGTDSGEDDQTKDPEYTSQASVAIPLMKGLIFTPTEIENYIDIWHYDEKEIADSGIFFSGEPWEITAATERLVVDGKLAYSRNEASVRGVGWLDPLVKEHADMIKAELQKMRNENFVPPALMGAVSADAAAERYDASIAWIEDHGHAIISNGAFYLDTFNTAGGTITIKAFRDESYPFEVGHWSKYEKPRLADITSIDVPRSVVIGQPAAVSLNLEVAGEPSSDATVEYFVSNKDSQLVARGKAEPDGEGKFRFELQAENTGKLSPGPNQLKVFASSNDARRFDISTSTILAASMSSTNNQTSNNQTGGTGAIQPPSGCLIATAAFGSELTPQVQYLRNFREHYILSTSSGAAFMNAFNSIYYSFSPQVADYEREQPWLQNVVKAGLYPLFGILMASERAHFVASGGEVGSIMSGALASMLIGTVYLWPATISARVQSRISAATKISLLVLGAAMALTLIGILAGNSALLMFSTPLIVLSIAVASALAAGWLVRRALHKLIQANINRKQF